MNKIILMGRLTRDPDVRYSQNEKQTAVAGFSIAVERRFRRDGEAEADFFSCTAFGRLGEFVERYLHKGSKVVLTGHLQNDNYKNRDGQQVYSVRVIVEEIEFAESRTAAGQQAAAGQATYSQQEPAVAVDDNGFMNIPDGIDEELPFN